MECVNASPEIAFICSIIPSIIYSIIFMEYFHHLYQLLHREKPFFGSGLEESLERIPPEYLHEPVGHRTIAQLLEHMLVWRKDLGNRLLGEPREKIELNSPQDWPQPRPLTKAEYLQEFADSTERLRAGIRRFDPNKINELLHPDYDYTNVDLLEGSAHHDIYHLGQINFISSVLAQKSR